MTQITRAKFRVTTVTQYDNGTVTAELKAVIGGSVENDKFFKWTPSATISMTTMNLEAAQQFVPGREMYVDFTPVMSDAEIVARTVVLAQEALNILESIESPHAKKLKAKLAQWQGQ